MTGKDELHVVGGSRATGRAIVRELATKGKRVRAVSRRTRMIVPGSVLARHSWQQERSE